MSCAGDLEFLMDLIRIHLDLENVHLSLIISVRRQILPLC
jgi:hypothetical protein